MRPPASPERSQWRAGNADFGFEIEDCKLGNEVQRFLRSVIHFMGVASRMAERAGQNCEWRSLDGQPNE